ncbi:hypothetical protein [Phreatobacter sp.]|uniref:hypothetical protein n=1 Tax=Phreatobacter sp. TaxID=1966341 RepID=UPI003F721BFE
MAIGQISPGLAGPASTGREAAAPAPGRNHAGPRVQTAGVTVTLSPEARQHLNRLEGFTATIGTSRQPKQMAKPGLTIDFRT